MNRSIFKLAGLGALCMVLSCAEQLRGQAGENILTNSGVEDWEAGSLGESGKTTDVPSLWRVGLAATEKAADPSFEETGAIFKDTAIKHGGGASVRIESEATTDIVYFDQLIPVEPNTTYKVSFWVRGEDIILNPGDGAGAISVASWGPLEDFWGNQVDTWKRLEVRDGTFDWQLVEYTVETGDAAEQLKVSMQLRRATGKVWYDDLEVIRVGEAGAAN
jgi:hypothetical protein